MPRQSRAGKIAGPQVQTATRPRTVTESCPSESGVDPLHFQGDVLFKILSYALWYGHRRLRLMAGPCGPSTAPAVPSTEVNITSVLCPQAEPSRSRMLVGLGRSPVSVLAPYCLPTVTGRSVWVEQWASHARTLHVARFSVSMSVPNLLSEVGCCSWRRDDLQHTGCDHPCATSGFELCKRLPDGCGDRRQ